MGSSLVYIYLSLVWHTSFGFAFKSISNMVDKDIQYIMNEWIITIFFSFESFGSS